MSARIRGQEAIVNFTVAGLGLLGGSFAKVQEFTATARTDLNEEGYLGETFDDLDIQHHGWDFSFSVHEEDGSSLDYLNQLLSNEESHLSPATVTMQVTINYREAGVAAKTLVFSDVVLKVNELGFAGRKELVSTSFEGKAKRLSIQ